MVTAPEPPLTNLQATDLLFSDIFRFLFEQNAIITWIHIIIGICGLALMWWVGKLDPDKLFKKSKLGAFARDVIYLVKDGASGFFASFAIGFVLFLVGVAFEGVKGVSSLLVQLLTYIPTLILGYVQLRATLTGVNIVKKHKEI